MQAIFLSCIACVMVETGLKNLLDQRRMLFWDFMMRSDNILHTLSNFTSYHGWVGSASNVSVLLMSDAGVKNAIWTSFVSFVYNVFGF